MSRRGTCPQCGRGVYTDQERCKIGDDYYHQECIDGGGSSESSSDGDPANVTSTLLTSPTLELSTQLAARRRT